MLIRHMNHFMSDGICGALAAMIYILRCTGAAVYGYRVDAPGWLHFGVAVPVPGFPLVTGLIDLVSSDPGGLEACHAAMFVVSAGVAVCGPFLRFLAGLVTSSMASSNPAGCTTAPFPGEFCRRVRLLRHAPLKLLSTSLACRCTGLEP